MLSRFPTGRIASRAMPLRFAARTFSETVALTGCTLQASIKMRCDTSGACYAIYWTKVDDTMAVAGGYNTPARKAALLKMGLDGYIEVSANTKLKATGTGLGPVATCYNSGKPSFIADMSAAQFMVRKEAVKAYGIQQCVWIPFEDGVLEYGTAKEGCDTNWTEAPVVPTMPKAVMRSAFEEVGAIYVMFWQLQDDGQFRAIADYVTPQRRAEIYNIRGNTDTFCSQSYSYRLPADGDGPCATAARTGKAQVLSNACEEPTFRRAALAKEFGIKTVHFAPVEGGVLEYGTA